MIIIAITAAITAILWPSYRYGWWLPAKPSNRPRILMYHMVSERLPGAKFRGLRVSPILFRKQIAYLARTGWTFVTMGELMQFGNTPPAKVVAITFDDGYHDNLTKALPVLREFNAKATLYLVVDRHDRDWSAVRKAHHNSGELAREPKLTDDHVRELLASGLIELGSHTLTHPNLPSTEPEDRWQEINESKQVLEYTFGVTVTSFAYPFGLYESADVDRVKKAGYVSAVTVEEGVEDQLLRRPLELRRVKISGKEGMFGFRMRMRRGIRGAFS